MKATLSPTIHESLIARHMAKDETDLVMQSLHDAVKLARELASKAATTTDAVLGNAMETEPQRHRKARAATFTLLEAATKALDAASKAAGAEIEAIKLRARGPSVTRDVVNESRMRELRERLSLLPEPQRKAVISEAIASKNDLLLAAVLTMPHWMSGYATPTELELVRHSWAVKNHGPALERLERLEKAVDDVNRVGALTITFVDSLTDAKLIEQAERTSKAADEAIAAAKVG